MKEADNGMIHYFQNGKFFTQDSAKGICNDEVFSVNAVFKAIETSTPLSNNTIIFDKELSKRCKLLAKHITKYEGESFVICTEGNNIQYIISRDLLITVKSITKLRNKFAVPPQLPQCKTVEVTSGPIQERMPWFKDEKTSCSLSWTKDESVCSPFMNLPKKRCVFIHGSGNKVVGPPAFGEWPRYWGDVHKYVPQCDTLWFARAEAVHRGWDDEQFQWDVCEAATAGTDDKFLIKDTTLFIHSLGNLVLTEAIRTGKCAIDTETTTWYSLGVPFDGSPAAIMVAEVCVGNWSEPIRWIAEKMCYCNGKKQSKVYESLHPEYPNLKRLTDLAKPYITGAMCGASSWGLNTKYAPALKIIGAMSKFKSDNDGMVGFENCANGKDDKFGDDPNDTFYRAKVNHADLTCRNGNGYFGIARKPCDYFINKT